MSQSKNSSPGRFQGPVSVELNSPITEAVGSPGHAAALLARINARARARKEGLLTGIKSVKENTEAAKTEKPVREKKLFNNSATIGSELSLDLESSDKKHVDNSNDWSKDGKCLSLTPKKDVDETTVVEFVVDATEDSDSVIKKIKSKLKNDLAENDEQNTEDVFKRKKKKKRKDVTSENDEVDSFIDEGNVECNENLELQPRKKKKKKRTNFEIETESLNNIENQFGNDLNNSGHIEVKSEIISKKDENEGKEEQPNKKVVATGFEDFFCISEEKENLTNDTESEKENIKGKKELTIKEENNDNLNKKDYSEKEAELQIGNKDLKTNNENLKSQEDPKVDTADSIKSPEKIIGNDEGKKKKRKKKKKSKELSEKDGNSIEGFTMMGEVQTVKKGKVQRVLPFWLSHPTVIQRDLQQGTESVDSINELDTKLISKLKEQKITSFFPIQKSVIPQILAGSSPVAARFRPRDICVSAPTGSGKTLAFVLPIVQALSGRVVPRIRALVLLPVQELATQVYKVFLTYAEHMGLNVGLAVGLKSFAKEQASLVRRDASGYHSLVDILVATPGKLSDHLQLTQGIDLAHLRYLVLDEADRMLAADGGEWVERIEKAVSGKLNQGPLMGSFPSPGCTLPLPTLPMQHLLFSATLSHDPEQLQHLTLYRPKLFTVTAQDMKSQTKEQICEDLMGVYTRPAELCEQFTVVEASIKPLVLHHLAIANNWRRTLVFTNTAATTHKLATLLQCLAKDRIVKEFSSAHKRERKQIVSQFMAGKIDMLISTDAMARGLDVPDIEQVVSYDVTSVSTYVHRIGRTARAGKTGTATSLVTKDDVMDYKNVLSQGGGVAEEISVSMEELEVYEETYKEALTKMKEVLLQEKQNKREKVDENKMKHKGRPNNKKGLKKGIKRLQNGKEARLPRRD